jgi:hypothetical protein
MLVAIVLAGAGTAVAAPDLAGSVGQALRRGLCVVAGGVCSPGEARALGMKPCPVHVRDNTEKLEAKVLVVKLARGDALVIERRSDGTASVSFVDDWKAGGEVGVGLRFSPLGIDGAADVGAGVQFAGGRTWDFPSLAAAERFVSRFAKHETLAGEVRDALPFVGGGPRLPEPDARYVEGGAHVELAAELELPLPGGRDARPEVGGGQRPSPGGQAAPLGAEVEVEGAVVLGRRLAGERTTWYVKVSGEAAGRLGAVIGALQATRDGEVALEVTQERGRPVELRVIAAAGLAQELALLGATTDLPALAGRLRSAAAAGQRQRGTGLAVEAQVALDLTDPANRGAAWDFLTAPTPSHAAVLARRLDADGSVDVNVFRTTRSETGVGAEAKLVAQLGGEYERVERGRSLIGAWSLTHGGSLRDREDCLPA